MIVCAGVSVTIRIMFSMLDSRLFFEYLNPSMYVIGPSSMTTSGCSSIMNRIWSGIAGPSTSLVWMNFSPPHSIDVCTTNPSLGFVP